jgi:hypothetical protein
MPTPETGFKRTAAAILLGLGVAACSGPVPSPPYGMPAPPPNVEPRPPAAGPIELREVYAYIRSYDRSLLDSVACHGVEPSPSDIGAFEQEVGFELPEVFREFMRAFGCFYMAAMPEISRRAPPAVRDRIGSGIKVFGVASGHFNVLVDIRWEYQRLHSASRGELVPFLQVGQDPDVFCFDRSGAISRWDHRAGISRPLNLSFPQLLLRELRALQTLTERAADD